MIKKLVLTTLLFAYFSLGNIPVTDCALVDGPLCVSGVIKGIPLPDCPPDGGDGTPCIPPGVGEHLSDINVINFSK